MSARAIRRSASAALVVFALIASVAHSGQPATARIATWNLEWLIAPRDFKKLKTTCAPADVAVRGAERRLPCDVATQLERSARDFSVLARYARELDADVVALQETDGADAARLVFPGYEFCFTGRNHLQNNGFAVRRGIPFRCGPDYRELSLNDSLRRGKELTLFPGTPGEVRLLNVHLKSGCSRKPLTERESACRDLSRQVPALDAWIDTQVKSGRRFVVLGDFNRDLISEATRRPALGPNESLWAGIEDGSRLRNAAQGEVFRNCAPGQGYHGYIDNIVVSRTLAPEVLAGSFARVTYSAKDARHAKLSDHCPVAIRVRIDAITR